jgi:hypothetical protein
MSEVEHVDEVEEISDERWQDQAYPSSKKKHFE